MDFRECPFHALRCMLPRQPLLRGRPNDGDGKAHSRLQRAGHRLHHERTHHPQRQRARAQERRPHCPHHGDDHSHRQPREPFEGPVHPLGRGGGGAPRRSCGDPFGLLRGRGDVRICRSGVMDCGPHRCTPIEKTRPHLPQEVAGRATGSPHPLGAHLLRRGALRSLWPLLLGGTVAGTCEPAHPANVVYLPLLGVASA